MSKNKWITSPIYELDYLMNNDLDEKDLHNIFDKDSMIYSMVVAQFKSIGDSRRDWEFIKECKTQENWQDKYYFKTLNERNKFRDKLAKCFMNIYQYKEYKSYAEADWFLLAYGFRCKESRKKK